MPFITPAGIPFGITSGITFHQWHRHVKYMLYLVLLICIYSVATQAACQFDRVLGINVTLVTDFPIHSPLAKHPHIHRDYRILKYFHALHDEFMTKYGIGINLNPVEMVDGECAGYVYDAKGVRLVTSVHPWCLEQREFSNGNTQNPGPGFNYPLLFSTEFTHEIGETIQNKITHQFKLRRLETSDDHCQEIVEEGFLVPVSSHFYNGVVEEGELCDALFPHEEHPCHDGKIKQEWLAEHTCDGQPIDDCQVGDSAIGCVRDYGLDTATSFPPDHCSKFIHYRPPNNLPYGLCINTRNCKAENYYWGVANSEAKPLPGGADHLPYNEAKTNYNYFGCYLPVKTRPPVCYDPTVITRPSEAKVVCVVKVRGKGGSSRITKPYIIDTSACLSMSMTPPDTTCTAEDIVRQFNLPTNQSFSPCGGFYCAPDSAYPPTNHNYTQYRRCLSAPIYGFSDLSCTVNRGRRTRHVGCYRVNQTHQDIFPLFEPSDECGEEVIFHSTEPSPCQYRWECPKGERPANTYEPCETCGGTNLCRDTTITTSPSCIWRYPQAGSSGKVGGSDAHWCDTPDEELMQGETAVIRPKPPDVDTKCKDKCKFTWMCFAPNQQLVPCAELSVEPYPCRLDPEDAECGSGVRDLRGVVTACFGTSTEEGGQASVDLSFCGDFPTFSCEEECNNNWVCQTFRRGVEGGDPVHLPHIRSCRRESIMESLQTLALCAEHSYYTTISCANDQECGDRPNDDFPVGTDEISMSIAHSGSCKILCFDALQKTTLAVGHNIPSQNEQLFCDSWAAEDSPSFPPSKLFTPQYTCSTSAPCQAGILRRGVACYDPDSNKVIRLYHGGDGGEPSPYCQHAFETIVPTYSLSAWCVNYDAQLCAVESRCAFQYLEQYTPENHPDGEPALPREPLPSSYHVFDQRNCGITSWTTIMKEYDNVPLGTTPPGICGEMGKIQRCYITPKQHTGDAVEPIWFPYHPLCDRNVPQLPARVYGVDSIDDPMFAAYRHTDHHQQVVSHVKSAYDGCAVRRCVRTVQGGANSGTILASSEYCYDEHTICHKNSPVPSQDRCGWHTLEVTGMCSSSVLHGEHGGIHGAGFLPESDCRHLPPPVPPVRCLYTEGCQSIHRECQFDPLPSSSSSSSLLPIAGGEHGCRDRCKTPLCGSYSITPSCYAVSRATTDTPSRKTSIDMPYCEAQEGFDPTPFPERCENYMGCTYWACSAWSSGVDPDAVNAGVVPLSELSEDQCSTLPSASLVRSMCSVPCGRGVIQRHVACISDGKIVPDHESHSRCGLHHVRPAHALPCKTEPRNCSATRECNISNRPLSYETCSWSASPDSCPSICGSGSGDDDDDNGNNAGGNSNNGDEDGTPVDKNYAVDITTRCVYRGTGAMLFAPPSKCMTDNTLNKPKSCPRTKDACCQSQGGSTPFDSTTSSIVSPQCSATPDGVIELSRFTLGRRGDSVAPRPSQQGYSVRSKFMLQDTTEQQRVTVITLDDPYTPMEWSYKGNAAGRSVSLYLLHPKLATPYLIDTVQLHAITSFSFSSMTMIPSSVVPPLINSAETPEPEDNDDGDNDGNGNNNDNEAPPLKPWDPSLYASVLAYVSPTVYAVLQYVEIIANPYPIRLANQPLLGLGSGFSSMYCGDTPCYNGRCVVNDDTKDALPTCQCYGGYTGVFCERLAVCQIPMPSTGDGDAPPQYSMRLPREAEHTKKHKYSMVDLPTSVTPLTQQQYDAMLDTMQSTATAQCDRQECLHQYFDANCSTCELSCASGRGTPNAQCSACECKQGYVGPQCNCRRVFLPVYHHRAPAFLEEHFSTTKRSTATASPTDIVEVPLTIRSQYNQWKRLVLNDVSLDLTYPVNSLDIADFGYHTENGSTAFVTLVAIDVCSDLLSTKGGVSYRSGNVTDLTLASLLLAEYTNAQTQREPLVARPVFLASTYRGGDITPTSADLRPMDDDDGSETTDTTSFFMALAQSFFSQPTPSGVVMSTTNTDTPVIQRAHSTASAPLLLQSVYHTPSSIATGVSQVYGSGFVKVVPLIDPACPHLAATTPAQGETDESAAAQPCYGSTDMPKLKKMPYGPASKLPPPVTLILILIFCLALPLIVILALLFWCWYKSIYLFKPKEEKSHDAEDPHGGTTSKGNSQSGTQMTQYKGSSGAMSKRSGVSMTTASTPHQMEDPDLHPDWKKVMGPAGEPIYINDTTLKSSKVRPLPDGTLPTQKSMFHRPTLWGKQ